MEFLLSEAGGLKQAMSAVSRTIHVCTSSLCAHSEKKNPTGTKQKQARSGKKQVCDAHTQPTVIPTVLPPCLLN